MLFIWSGVVLIATALIVILKPLINDEDYNRLIETKAKWEETTDDPCKYFLVGDPAIDSKEYVKIFLKCKNGKNSVNTLAIKAIKNKTIKGAIEELGEINHFEGSMIENKEKWSCQIDSNIVDNFDLNLKDLMNIECNEK